MGEKDKENKGWLKPKLPSIDQKIIKRQAKKVEGATIRHAHKFLVKRWINVREVQSNVITWIIAIGLLIGATGLQVMWDQQNYQTEAASINGTYAEAVLGPVNSLNPLYATTSAEQSAGYLLFSRLLNYDVSGHLSYDLVKNIKINETRTVYTVALRPDVKWTDGQKLTAQDVAFTIDLMKNPSAHTVYEGWGEIIDKVIDDNTIEFTLKSPFAAFENALTFPVLPKHILGKIAPVAILENDFSKEPVGSGPFKLGFVQEVDAKTGQKIINLTRNDDYYKHPGKLARFQLHVYGNTDSMIAALLKGEVNAITGVPATDVAQIDAKQFNVMVKPIGSGVYAILNTKSSVLQNLKIRQALQLATDTKAVLKDLPKGTPELGLPITANLLSGTQPTVPTYDQAAAKKILDDEGWKLTKENTRQKDGQLLRLNVVTLKSSEFERVLETIAGQWRSIGVTVDTKVLDPTDVTQSVVQNILQPRNYDALIYQLNIGGDPDVYAYWHSSQAIAAGFNFSNYSNSVSDVALASARDRLEPQLRSAKYITFEKQWLSDVPAIGLYQSTTIYATNRNAHSVTKDSILISPVDRYSNVSDWSADSHSVYKTP